MSTTLEQSKQLNDHDFVKLDENKNNMSNNHNNVQETSPGENEKSQQHPLHQYDLSKMAFFYESCKLKLSEQNPSWNQTEWIKATPIPNSLSPEEQKKWSNPVVISEKQRVYQHFANLAKDLGEPMILMPNFDINDLEDFQMFLESLKTDGVNAIRKFKQYLNNRGMRKQEIDLVCIHARYGILLVEVKDNDYVDFKRKSRAKMIINQTKSIFKSLGRLIAESKGLSPSESSVPIMEFIALPNVQERPNQSQQKQKQSNNNQDQQASETQNQKGENIRLSTSSRQLNYLVKSDLENNTEFMKWWSNSVVEPKLEQEKSIDDQKKVNKFDLSMMNALVALVNCIRSNSILPVVYPESGENGLTVLDKKPNETKEDGDKDDKLKDNKDELQFQQALNIYAEFFKPKHEEARSLSRCLVLSKDSERIRKTICLQTLWLLLNDSQKKISVVCSDLNKPYYEEFFSRQRKIYANLNNVRFYTDLHSCDVSGAHTLKKDGDVWFFDASIPNGSLSDVLERVKSLNSFWVFSSQTEQAKNEYQNVLTQINTKIVDLDEDGKSFLAEKNENTCIKLPLRLQCDLLIIGDMISANQLKFLYKFLNSKSVQSQASYYQQHGSNNNSYHPHMQQLNFNASKKFRSVKFIRGGSIENIRNSLKMHDSIQAQCVIMHVGDEDLFKTRNSVATIERVKELATLVKEYCPKSFVVLSTLMRRMSRTENSVTNEVNKGIVNFCKQTKESLNCFYMMNNHFEPDYHTQGGRLLNNKGLKLYVENILFVVDYFLVKNNKQH
jgi:hypothetical protein